MLNVLPILALAVQQPPAAAAAAQDAPRAAPSDEIRLEQAAGLGRTIYLFDRAAWVSTDALRAKVPKDQLGVAGGYVVEIADDSTLRVTYYRGDAATGRAFFTADVRKGKVVESRLLPDAVPLTPEQTVLATARAIAAKDATARDYRPCTPRPFNTVVLPPRSGGPVLVYLLTAQTDARRYMMGGNYVVLVGPDGRVMNARPFGKSCLPLDAPELPAGATAMGFFVNHILDTVPTEIHVFASYSMRAPLFVGTSDGRQWKVAGDTITPAKIPVR